MQFYTIIRRKRVSTGVAVRHTLLLWVKANVITVQLNEPSGTLREEWASADWPQKWEDLLVRQPVDEVRLLLYAEHATCQRTPLPALSPFDRYWMRMRLRRCTSPDKAMRFGPFEQNSETHTRHLLTPEIQPSSLSLEVVHAVQKHTVAVDTVDMDAAAQARGMFTNAKEAGADTQWQCLLYQRENNICIAVCWQKKIVLLRTLTSAAQDTDLYTELTQTLQYVRRIGYPQGAPIHMLSSLPPGTFGEEPQHALSDELQAPLLWTDLAPVDPEEWMRNQPYPELSQHQRAHRLPTALHAAAGLIAAICCAVAGTSWHNRPALSETTVSIQGNMRTLPIEENVFTDIKRAAEKQEDAIAVWALAQQDSIQEHHFLQTAESLLAAAHRGKFLLSLRAYTERDELRSSDPTHPHSRIIFSAEFAPAFLYRDEKFTRDEIHARLKQEQSEASKALQQACPALFPHMRLKTKILTKERKLRLDARLGASGERTHAQAEPKKNRKPRIQKKAQKKNIGMLLNSYQQ